MHFACQTPSRNPYGPYRVRELPCQGVDRYQSPGIIAVLLFGRGFRDGHATRYESRRQPGGGANRSSGWCESLHPRAGAGAKAFTLVGGSSPCPPVPSGPEPPPSRGWAPAFALASLPPPPAPRPATKRGGRRWSRHRRDQRAARRRTTRNAAAMPTSGSFKGSGTATKLSITSWPESEVVK